MELKGENGVLPDHRIEALVAKGAITSGAPILDAQIQPASLDLRLGARAYRLRASFLASSKATVSERLEELTMHAFSLEGGAVLERGCVYLIPLQEELRLPETIEAVANAKSSTGRLDLLTRLVTEDGTEFDRVVAGYQGALYAEICPRSFSVLVRPDQTLNQIRFRTIGTHSLKDEQLIALHREERLVNRTESPVIRNGLGFSVDLDAGEDGLLGWRAKPHSGVIDLGRIAAYPAREFWEPIYKEARPGRIILDPGAFYILVSREAVHIPPLYAAEMAPYLAMVGEFRVHYAGFFDPGFGHESAGGAGARGVLEVRCHEVPFLLEHGQTVGRLIYEPMIEPPKRLYGADLKSNYQGQGLKLAKQFKN